ncbi:leader peptidase (prepilin peptidase) / N-methyltransferase [Lachnospiraceae bacterium YSD2013]|nr:leader peptidase (prepilin peptidase) / N-methyltransferase [Lachnospiraceae bacterium YSD2013]
MPAELLIPIYIFVFLFGIVIGSFLNVCMIRIPRGESIVTEGSHCMKCGYRLRWYDLIPLFSWLFLRGKCRKCGEKISPQYPVVEFINGAVYVFVFVLKGITIESLLLCLLFSALFTLSVIDFKTYEIPVGFNIFIAVLGLVRLFTDLSNWKDYLIGAVSISLFLLILLLVSKGRAIGGGDVKLMAAAGLFLGWKCAILAFMVGCILGACIHLIRMKVSKEGSVLAMGPYLSAGIFIAALWGVNIITWYLGFYAF